MPSANGATPTANAAPSRRLVQSCRPSDARQQQAGRHAAANANAQTAAPSRRKFIAPAPPASDGAWRISRSRAASAFAVVHRAFLDQVGEHGFDAAAARYEAAESAQSAAAVSNCPRLSASPICEGTARREPGRVTPCGAAARASSSASCTRRRRSQVGDRGRGRRLTVAITRP